MRPEESNKIEQCKVHTQEKEWETNIQTDSKAPCGEPHLKPFKQTLLRQKQNFKFISIYEPKIKKKKKEKETLQKKWFCQTLTWMIPLVSQTVTHQSSKRCFDSTFVTCAVLWRHESDKSSMKRWTKSPFYCSRTRMPNKKRNI